MALPGDGAGPAPRGKASAPWAKEAMVDHPRTMALWGRRANLHTGLRLKSSVLHSRSPVAPYAQIASPFRASLRPGQL